MISRPIRLKSRRLVTPIRLLIFILLVVPLFGGSAGVARAVPVQPKVGQRMVAAGPALRYRALIRQGPLDHIPSRSASRRAEARM